MNASALFDGEGWMNPNRPHHPLAPHYREIAALLNATDTPQKEADHKIREYRIRDGKLRKWSKTRLGNSLGMCRRQAQSLSNDNLWDDNSRRELPLNLLALLVEGLSAGTRLTVLQARNLLKEKYQKAHPEMVGYCPVQTDEAMRRILREGLNRMEPEKGLFIEKIEGEGRGKEPVFFRTSESFKWPRPQTPEERAGVAWRANRLLLKMDSSVVEVPKRVISIPVELGLSGVNQLLERVINNEERFKPLWDFMHKHEEPAKKWTEARGRQPTYTVGTLATICLQSADLAADRDPLAPLSLALTHSVAQTAEVWPLRMHLHPKGQAAFRKAWPDIVKEFENEIQLAHAASSGDARKLTFVVSLGWTLL